MPRVARKKIPGINLELNITLACNLKCPSCNRCCDVYPERDDSMTVQQVEEFVDKMRAVKAKGNINIKKIKVVGGEPLVHPDFVEIYEILLKAMTEEELYRGLKINTNATKEIPVPRHPRVRWLMSPPKWKKHLPYLWSPVDLGYEVKGPCDMPRRCGFSLDERGFLPCSAAIMLVRAFDLEHLYKDEIPEGVWGVEELCKNCVHGMPKEWIAEHSYFKKDEPTESWKKALENYDRKEKERKLIPLTLVGA